MPLRERYDHGVFCWNELVTANPQDAAPFYGDVLGWTFVEGRGGDGLTCVYKDAPVAALRRPRAEEPAGWTPMIHVDDVDAIVGLAEGLGARMEGPVADRGQEGRHGVMVDPGGARVGLWQAGGFAGAGLFREPSAPFWNEMVTRDYERVKDFYHKLFGWEYENVSEPVRLSRCRLHGADFANILDMTSVPAMPPGLSPKWGTYFAVESCEATRQRVTKAGGMVMLDGEIDTGKWLFIKDTVEGAFTVMELKDP